MYNIKDEAIRYSREAVMGYNASDEEYETRTGEDTKYLIACVAKAYIDGRKVKTITRLEVIDHSKDGNGRAYTNHDVTSVEMSYQDDDKTLKLFIK